MNIQHWKKKKDRGLGQDPDEPGPNKGDAIELHCGPEQKDQNSNQSPTNLNKKESRRVPPPTHT